MNSSINLISILFRASFLAFILFWVFVFSEGLNFDAILFILLSFIPISIVCSLTILITIMPFYWLEQNTMTEKEIFKKYFPYYSMVTFCVCSYFIVSTNFENFTSAFFITAFFTLMKSWVWAGNTETKNEEKKLVSRFEQNF